MMYFHENARVAERVIIVVDCSELTIKLHELFVVVVLVKESIYSCFSELTLSVDVVPITRGGGGEEAGKILIGICHY